jgi:FkbM family methyltransferase
VRLKYLDSSDIIVRNDAKQVKFFLEKIRPGDFVLDVGGNVGQYAVFFSALVAPSGKVITFEPDSQHRNVLRRNLQLNKFPTHVEVEDIALSDTAGTHSFFSRNDAMSSLVRSGLGTNADSPDIREEVVTTMRLDEYLKTKELGSPDWVKIDTEGAEINILRGAREMLQSGAKIVCELHPYAWEEFGTSYEELLTIVRDCGRQISYLDESVKIEDGAVHGAVIIS